MEYVVQLVGAEKLPDDEWVIVETETQVIAFVRENWSMPEAAAEAWAAARLLERTRPPAFALPGPRRSAGLRVV